MKQHRFKNILLYGDVTKEEYGQVQDIIREENFKMWKIVSVVLAIFAMILLVITYAVPDYFVTEGISVDNVSIKFGIAYSVLAVYSIAIAFLFNVFGKKFPRLVNFLISISNVLLLLFFACVCTILDKGNLSVIYCVLIAISSLLTIRAPYKNIIINLLSTAIFIVLACFFERGIKDILIDDLVYSIVFSIVGVVFGSFFNCIRIKDFALRNFVEQQRDYDSLTKAKSKIAYDREVSRIMERLYQNSTCNPFALVIFDVNGLKVINDNYGHENGDELLIRAVDLIQEHFKSNLVYRIGGDEFAVIIKGDDYKNRNDIVRKFRASVQKTHDESSSILNDTPIACGMATYDPDNDIDFMSVFSRADTIMYDDKRSMKLKNEYLIKPQDEDE